MKPYGFKEAFCRRRSGDHWPDKQFGERRTAYHSKARIHRYFKKNGRRISQKVITEQLTEGEYQHRT